MKKKAKSNCLILTKHPGKCCKNSCISFYCPYFVCVPSSYTPPENIVTRVFTWTGSTWPWPCWRLLWWTLWLISSLQSHISPTRARYTFTIYHNQKWERIYLVCLEDILETYWSGLQRMLKLWENVWIHEVLLNYNLGEKENGYYSSTYRSTESKKNISNAKIHLNNKEMKYKLPVKHSTCKNW